MLKATDKTEARAQTFEEVKENIKSGLLKKKKGNANWLKTLTYPKRLPRRLQSSLKISLRMRKLIER